MTVNTYVTLNVERNELMSKAGDELNATINRLHEIDQLLKEADAAIPWWTGGSTNYKNELSLIGMAINSEITKQLINNSLYSKEEYKKGVRDSFFVGCIIGCTVIAIAFYLAALFRL